jgi:hypothetical protein
VREGQAHQEGKVANHKTSGEFQQSQLPRQGQDHWEQWEEGEGRLKRRLQICGICRDGMGPCVTEDDAAHQQF